MNEKERYELITSTLINGGINIGEKREVRFLMVDVNFG